MEKLRKAFTRNGGALTVSLLCCGVYLGITLIFFGLMSGEEMIWKYGTTWYPSVLAIPGTMYLFCKLFEFAEKRKWLGWSMWLHNIAGRYSFEIFMLHMVLYELVPIMGLHLRSPFTLGLMAVTAGVISVFYGMGVDRLRKKLGW